MKKSGLQIPKNQFFEKILKKAIDVFCYIGMGMLMVLMLLGAIDVFGRYFLGKPITGAMETSTILLAGIVFFGMSHTQSVGGNVRVDLFLSRFPPMAKFVASFASSFIGLVIYSLIMWQGLEIAIIYWKTNRLVDVINIPLAYFQLFVPIGSLFLCLEFIIEMRYFFLKMKTANKGN